jgi:putative tryptophan/tyrosine transport system substrate-binding protein
MRRREFISLLGGAAVGPIAARAQQPDRVRRVGVLMPFAETDRDGQRPIQTFRQGLADLGWIEGRNLRIDVGWAGPDAAAQRSHARDLVALAPEVILASGTIASQALRDATRDATRAIPIIFVGLIDPVATGIVSNLARPEANVTGFMNYEHSMAGKWLSLLKDVAPRLTRVAVLFHPEHTWAPFYVRTAQDAGERLSLKVTAAVVPDVAAIEPAIAAMSGDGGLVILPDGFNIANRATTIALAAKHRVPAIYTGRYNVVDGGLMSYGAEILVAFRDGATYVDRILRGAKPGELPVQFATKFDLVINLKTAKALGLELPQTLLALADEIIE